jgi:DNA polymerase I-like protein with 3'-5' exonuclease and polymerase domains
VADHADEAYALKDAEYTWKLAKALEPKLKAAGCFDFYHKHLLPWARMIMRAEYRGITIDNDLMGVMEAKAQQGLLEAARQLDEVWADAHLAYREMKIAEMRADYQEKAQRALEKMKKPTTNKRVAVIERYRLMADKSITKNAPIKINLGSPDQLSWLLKEHLKLDITTFKGDEESTGKPVLQRLAGTRSDVRTFLQYRSHSKLLNAFFPSYRQMQVRNAIHCGFNLDIARTGRLSSSEPNLQQVPGALNALFIARA